MSLFSFTGQIHRLNEVSLAGALASLFIIACLPFSLDILRLSLDVCVCAAFQESEA